VVPANEVNPPLKFQLRDIRHVHPYLAVRGFDEEECEYLGVGFFPGRGMMQNRIVFPLHDAEGVLIGYAGRRVEYSLHDEDPAHVAPECPNLERWIFPAGFLRGQVLYNLHRVEGSEVVVCESFWGALACIRAGIMNVVAIMSNYATKEQVKLLAGFEKVTILFDGDEPGRKGAADLKSKLPNAEVKTLADGVQPDQVRPDTLRVMLGFSREPEVPITLTSEALQLLEA
jgi:DNA primase